MNSFVNAVRSQRTTTTNGMGAFTSTRSRNVDLFYKIGASRGKNVIPDFTAAVAEDKEVALRVLQWSRDVRKGAGERQIFRDVLLHLSTEDPDAAIALLYKVPELGRFDDLLIDFPESAAVVKYTAFSIIRAALEAGNGLCAKWMPRKGRKAVELRNFLGWSPKYYRKRLVELTKVVETQMCAGKWDEINFNHVPSLAMSRSRKAFERHTPKFAEWAGKVAKGEDKTVKVNAAAVYPYDVLKGLTEGGWSPKLRQISQTERNAVIGQWAALPNYVGDASILPLIDVSGSMFTNFGKCPVMAVEIAVSLGLYMASKNTGPFKDTVLTFTTKSKLLHVQGDVIQKLQQVISHEWHGSTNFVSALELILKTAKDGDVPASDMPKMLLVFSDMQFDQAGGLSYGRQAEFTTGYSKLRELYQAAGYEIPQVVFWNLNAHDNVPVKMDERGVALVSGFSPTIVKSLLSGNLEEFTPEGIMLSTVMKSRYDLTF